MKKGGRRTKFATMSEAPANSRQQSSIVRLPRRDSGVARWHCETLFRPIVPHFT